MTIKRKVKILDSTNIETVGYDAERSKLLIAFKGGKLYMYSPVTRQTFGELVSAESVGKYFSENIRGKYSESELDLVSKK